MKFVLDDTQAHGAQDGCPTKTDTSRSPEPAIRVRLDGDFARPAAVE